jgi:hypothetical protein
MSGRNLFPIEYKLPVENSYNNQQTTSNTEEDIGIIKQLLIIIWNKNALSKEDKQINSPYVNIPNLKKLIKKIRVTR